MAHRGIGRRQLLFPAWMPLAKRVVIEAAHLPRLHPQLDDLELVQPRHLFGTIALLAFAQRDAVGDAHEPAVCIGVVPSASPEAEERVGGGADVAVVDESE